MDGTLSWVPFVVQTVTMARNVHRRRYRMGPGYRVNDDGTVIENYWERLDDEEPEQVAGRRRKPYRIELVGVVCDAYLAVIRGIRYITRDISFVFLFRFQTFSKKRKAFPIETLRHEMWHPKCQQESYHV